MEYAFENAIPQQRERLRTLEALFDSGTVRVLEARAVQPSWRCLEVGAGGGSIALWLAERAGSVLATDLDITHLRSLSAPNLEVREHDLLRDELPDEAFDLIHLRLVLAWLPDPAVALARLHAALRPGGWLVAEELDFNAAIADPHMDASDQALFGKVLQAHNATLRLQSGFDAYYGRRVYGDLADAGLGELGCEGHAAMWRGGEAGGRIWRQTVAQLRETMVERGLASPAEVDEALALYDDERFSSVSPLLMAAWGRRGSAAA